jgi:hypothetical protein
MATILSFSSLVEAISRAVAQAQDAVERHQVANLLNYFDRDDRPKSFVFKVPSRRPDAGPTDEDQYHVPVLSLLSVNVLKIRDVSIKFSVDLGEIDDAEGPADTRLQQPGPPPSASAQAAPKVRPMRALNVSTVTGRGGGQVEVTLRVKGSKPSEGALRLLDQLTQLQGVYPEVKESSDEPGREGNPS